MEFRIKKSDKSKGFHNFYSMYKLKYYECAMKQARCIFVVGEKKNYVSCDPWKWKGHVENLK